MECVIESLCDKATLNHEQSYELLCPWLHYVLNGAILASCKPYPHAYNAHQSERSKSQTRKLLHMPEP